MGRDEILGLYLSYNISEAVIDRVIESTNSEVDSLEFLDGLALLTNLISYSQIEMSLCSQLKTYNSFKANGTLDKVTWAEKINELSEEINELSEEINVKSILNNVFGTDKPYDKNINIDFKEEVESHPVPDYVKTKQGYVGHRGLNPETGTNKANPMKSETAIGGFSRQVEDNPNYI
ncbi:hypothetical protein ACFLTH_13450 [Bacteroidota bacterium]